MNIMQSVMSRNMNAEDKADILAKKAEASILNITANIIKVILVSCFCSQTEDSNLVGNLQRKISSIGEDSAGRIDR